MYNRDKTRISSLVVPKPSFNHGRPSSNPRRSYKGNGGGRGHKLSAEGINWSSENEGNVRPLREKDYALLNAEQIVYISLVIITIKFFLCYYYY